MAKWSSPLDHASIWSVTTSMLSNLLKCWNACFHCNSVAAAFVHDGSCVSNNTMVMLWLEPCSFWLESATRACLWQWCGQLMYDTCTCLGVHWCNSCKVSITSPQHFSVDSRQLRMSAVVYSAFHIVTTIITDHCCSVDSLPPPACRVWVLWRSSSSSCWRYSALHLPGTLRWV